MFECFLINHGGGSFDQSTTANAVRKNPKFKKLPNDSKIRFVLFSNPGFIILAHMIKRIAVVLALTCLLTLSSVFSADAPPSEASIKQLLEAGQAHEMVDAMFAQMDAFMKQTMQQAAQGQQLSPKIQKDIEKRHNETMASVKELLDWNKLEPMYVRVYQKSFTQQEVDGMIAFYKTPIGQAVLNKMPVVLQNTMAEVQQMMQPMVQRMQRMQQEVVAEIQAEKNKGGG